ncbi:IS4 family transposase [Acaryochloris marina NIES-2412]|uniref:IS4 family transposase n=1 Tax=Acaryochloris marina TaxID=155978 RepID=UPI0040594396
MNHNQSVSIRQISQDRAEQVGFYRFLENENVSISELVKCLCDQCQQQVKGRHILAVNDTSEVNLQSHSGRLKLEELGVVGNNRDVGFFIHPTLALDAATGFPLGLSALQLWTRDPNRPTVQERGGYKNLPIEEKESFKWLASAERSQHCLRRGGASLVTHIGDRESDLYEEWATVPDAFNHLLVRVRQDRRLLGQSQSLYEYLNAQRMIGLTTMTVEYESRTQRMARDATLVIRCAPVKIQRPEHLKDWDYPPSIQLYAVEAIEHRTPKGQKPIHWRLLTTHTVESREQALQILKWYQWRWKIERLFAQLKQTGLDLESTQLESGKAIQRLSVLALSVAVATLQMVEGRDEPQWPASVTFTDEQQQYLQEISPTLDGKTQKQQNPYPLKSLAWATWIIARLGGWKGYQSQRPPGTATLTHGLKRFEAMFFAWKIAQNRLMWTP